MYYMSETHQSVGPILQCIRCKKETDKAPQSIFDLPGSGEIQEEVSRPGLRLEYDVQE